MPRKILLIESDAPFAREMASALEKGGFAAQVSGDGKEGLDLARDLRPDAIVLCVELPKMSGYSICNKLKKDDGLRTIPLVIISAEATAETFEQHKKLKTRAEDYLIKPFPPSELVDRIVALVGAPELGAGDEEVVTLADVELEALGGPDPVAVEPIEDLPFPGRQGPAAPAPVPDEDEDLKLLDDAFESIATGAPVRDEAPAAPPPPSPPKDERPVDEGEIDAASASLPEADEGPARAEIDALGEEADAALAALGAEDEPQSDEAIAPPPPTPPPPARPGPALRGASADALRAAGIPVLDAPPPAPAASSRETVRVSRDLVDARRPGDERDRETAELRQKLAEARSVAEEAQREAERRDAEVKAGKAKLDAIAATVKRLEIDLKMARDEARRAGEKAAAADQELAALRDRVDDAERAAVAKGAEAAEAVGKTEALEREIDDLRTELVAARGDAEGARGEADKRAGELRRRVQELEAATAKNEERIVKAYQKIKGDEKLREKTRKALTIALQLLDERSPGEPEKDRPAARE